jgi:SAM-dependent methyltransferase
VKRILKSLGRFAGITKWSKTMAFQWQKWHYKKANRAFKINHPTNVLPPDKWLFETFKLDYTKYVQDGSDCAKEIIEWTKPFLPEEALWKILDWGCGPARVTQHIHQFAPNSLVYGADNNRQIIDWNNKHIGAVLFHPLTQEPTLPYPSDFFHLVYGISVFTHLPINLQITWLQSLLRVISKGGILILSTHGSFFEKKLSSKQISIWKRQGFLELVEGVKGLTIGDRNFSVYQDASSLEAILEIDFKILQFFEGIDFPEKMGGQDLWILQKK